MASSQTGEEEGNPIPTSLNDVRLRSGLVTGGSVEYAKHFVRLLNHGHKKSIPAIGKETSFSFRGWRGSVRYRSGNLRCFDMESYGIRSKTGRGKYKCGNYR